MSEGKSVASEARPQAEEPLRVVSASYVVTAWALLAAILALLLGSFFLRVPIVIEGQGMLMGGTEVIGYSIVPESEGRLQSLAVRVGSNVRKGEIVGRVSNPRLESEIQTAERLLQDLKRKNAALQAFHKQSLTTAQALLERQRVEAEKREAGLTERISRLDRARATDVDLVKRGFLSPRASDPIKTEREQVEDQLYVGRRQLTEAETNFSELSQRQRREGLEIDLQIRAQERQLEALLERRSIEGVLVAPFDGVITEILADLQSPVSRDRRVATLAPQLSNELGSNTVTSALLFVPAAQGKRLKVGMRARALPTMYDPQQFGRIEGEVIGISPFAADEDTLMRVFKNQKLVRKLFENDAPQQVIVALTIDPKTPSGLAWSSSRGPEQALEPGTIVSGWVAYDRPRLLFLLLPALKRWGDTAWGELMDIFDSSGSKHSADVK